MDRTAITMCIENGLPIVVFDMGGKGNLAGVLRGAEIGTIVGARRGDHAWTLTRSCWRPRSAWKAP